MIATTSERRSLRGRVALAAALALLASAGAAAAATLTVVDHDPAGSGLNDPAPATPVGGNSGTTLGAQRLNAMQYAANLWGAVLASGVEIRIGASFASLPCNSSSAVIGQTGPNSVHRDFAGAPAAGTWYPAALANSLAHTDLRPGSDDMDAEFNAAIGTTCAFSATFYYGFDARPPAGRIDLVSVALHEFGHGLGFLTFVNSAGAKLSGLDDAYMRRLEDHRTARVFPAMTDAERAGASLATGSLHWIGPFADAFSGVLTAGVGPGGHIQIYAPSTYQSGSSVSHVDTAASPNEVMEPSYTGPNHDLALTLEFMEDLGWRTTSSAPSATPTRTATPHATPTPASTAPPTSTPVPVSLCGAAPATGCRTSVAAGKGSLSMLDKQSDDGDTFSWSWQRDAITTKADFGDPLTTVGYELCVYDGAATLVMRATAPAGGTCPAGATGEKPCWSARVTGFHYNDKARTPLGLQDVTLKSGTAPGTARISVKGKGVALALPTLPLLQPLTVQLKSSAGRCWQATYAAPALKNTAGPPGRFRDKSD